MGNLMKPIAESLRLTDYVVELVMSDMNTDEASGQDKDADGPSISWIVGHLCYNRYEMLKAIGESVDNPFARFKDRESDRADRPDLADLLRSWKETSERIQRVADRVTDDQLSAPAGEAGRPHEGRTVLDRMVYFMWHESYHMGQLGTIRARLGYPSTADLVSHAVQSRA